MPSIENPESAYTVDAGHFQFEMKLAAWTKDGRERELALWSHWASVALVVVLLTLFWTGRKLNGAF